MKRKIVGAALLVALVVAAGWNFSQSKNEVTLSEIGLANVEALAFNEGTGSCRVRVSCGSENNFVECSGSTCEREDTTFSRWVKCDGVKTHC